MRETMHRGPASRFPDKKCWLDPFSHSTLEACALLDPHQAQQTQSTQHSRARRWTRYAVSLSLRVLVPTAFGQEYMLAHGRDVSQGGMAVYVPVELEIGQSVLLELIFHGLQRPVALSAMVKNRTGFKYGIEFYGAITEQQESILANPHKLVISTRLPASGL